MHGDSTEAMASGKQATSSKHECCLDGLSPARESGVLAVEAPRWRSDGETNKGLSSKVARRRAVRPGQTVRARWAEYRCTGPKVRC